MSNPVLIENDGNVRIITLNRPERLNAINDALLDGLNGALAAANADDSVGAVIVRGAGRAFCAGDDLIEQEDMEGLGEDQVRPFVEAIQDVTRNIMFGDKVVIAAVRGWAVGGAFSWPINADFAIWTDGARGFFPEITYGIFVSGGVTYLLPQLVSRIKAHEMLYLSRKYDGAALAECGLAWRVVAEDALDEAALELARYIADLPSAARRAMKHCLTRIDRDRLETAMAMESDAVVESILDPETYRRIREVSERGRKK
ncbi:MAG: enoyl-CoA hydratase/isomerase family protein [Alphaproteobacteria bacterium]|nr:enoyl-CoA hydratase/isomerase family protein [Alphaproteobacteria bacterium]